MPTLDQLLPLLAAEPEDTFLRYAVAMAYAKESRFDESLREFSELTRRQPDYVPAHFMAGRTAETKGDFALAKSWYQSGLAAAGRTGDSHAASEIASALAVLE